MNEGQHSNQSLFWYQRESVCGRGNGKEKNNVHMFYKISYRHISNNRCLKVDETGYKERKWKSVRSLSV